MNLSGFMREHRLPDVFVDSAKHCYLPFAEWLETQLQAYAGKTYILGINGAQGTGKSTMADLLRAYLSNEHGRRVVVLSIDDIYLTRAERESLAKNVHPLLRTRGVPGTHDVALGQSVLAKLRALKSNETLSVPRFDKSQDDRFSPDLWSVVTGQVDLVILEGWCVASPPAADTELREPINALESTEDKTGRWRRYVNEKLHTEYAELFSCLNSVLFLKAPDFDAVHRWRTEQERKLQDRSGADATAIMNDDQVARFIQHYERITRSNIAVLPSIADAVIELADDHQAVSLNYPKLG